MKSEFLKILKVKLDTLEYSVIYSKEVIVKYKTIREWVELFILEQNIYFDDIKTFSEFFNFEDIKKKLRKSNPIECLYRRVVENEYYWTKALVERFNKNEVLIKIKIIEKANNIMQEALNILAINIKRIVKGNLSNDTYEIIKTTNEFTNLSSLKKSLMEIVYNKQIEEEYEEGYIDFLDNMSNSIIYEPNLKFVYRSLVNNEYRYFSLEVIRTLEYMDECKKVMIYIKDINNIMIKEIFEEKRKRKNDLIIANMSRDYCAIVYADLKNNLIEKIKCPPIFNKIFNYTNYEETVKKYANEYISNKYKETFLNITLNDIKNDIKNNKQVSFFYKNIHNVWLELTIMSSSDFIDCVIFSFRYRNDYIKNLINEKASVLAVEKVYDTILFIDESLESYVFYKNPEQLIIDKIGKFSTIINYLKENIIKNYEANLDKIITCLNSEKNIDIQIGFMYKNEPFYYEISIIKNKIYEEQNYIILGKNVTKKVNEEMKNHILSTAVLRSFDSIIYINTETLKCEIISEGTPIFAYYQEKNYNELYDIGLNFIDDDESLKTFFSLDNLKKIARKNGTDEMNFFAYFENRTLRVNSVIFKDDLMNKDCVIILFRDVTNSYNVEVESKKLLTDAISRANEANNAKSDFLSKVSHDLRTPLNAVIGMTYLAKQNIDDRIKTEEYLNKIDSSSNHLLSIVNEILDMSKLQSGKSVIEEERIDLEELFIDIAKITELSIVKKDLVFNMNFDVKNKLVISDELKIRKILLNLLSNSIKYTIEPGKIDLNLREVKSTNSKLGKYIIEVIDNGVGIDEEFLNRIFVPFERAHDTRINKIQGTGLGMPIVKNLIDILSGSIKIDSKLNEGTKITVVLQMKLQDDHNIVENKQLGVIKKFINKKVLIIEDNELNLEIVEGILNSFNIITKGVSDGYKGIEEFKKDDYDLILCDIQMPSLNGYETTKKIRSLDKHDSKSIKIVAMTANAFESDIERSIQSGMNDHLCKPIVVNELIKTLNKYL